MIVSVEDLNRIFIDGIEIGVMKALKAYEPANDHLRLADVKRWLEINHIDYKLFQKLVNKGLIQKHQLSPVKNSPFVFHKSEIKQALAVARIHSQLVFEAVGKIKDI